MLRSTASFAALLWLTSVVHLDGCYPLAIDLSPASLNVSMGSTAMFQCGVYDVLHFHYDFEVFWLVINGTTGHSFYIQNNSVGDIAVSGQISSCFHNCESYLSIPASAINNNTEVQCSASFAICPEVVQNSSVALLLVQGHPESPSDLQLQNTENGLLHFNWTAPYTLSAVPILQYSIYIYDYTTKLESIINTTVNEYTLPAPPCGVEVSVTAWNAAGEGKSTIYSTKEDTLINVDVSKVDSAPDELCVVCHFNEDSDARGCYVTVTQNSENNLTFPRLQISLYISQDKDGISSSVLKCLTGLQAHSYRVVVQEVQCDGELGNSTFVWPVVSITGQSPVITNQGQSPVIHNAAVIGLAVVVAVLAAALLVMMVVIVTVFINTRRDKKTASVDITTPPQSSLTDYRGNDPSQNTYENIELNSAITTQPRVPNIPTAIHTEACAAYGIVGRR